MKLAAFAVLGTSFAGLSLCPAQVASHSAPWVGETLELEFSGLPAGTPLLLYASGSRIALPTAFGLLEIDPVGALLVANTATTAQGTRAFQIPVPANPALAEAPLHWQGLYLDGSSPAGAALTPGIHLRLLGSRLHGVRSELAVPGPGLIDAYEVLSSPSLTPVVSLDLPPGWATESGPPVLSANGAFAAAVTNGGLLRFDHFFGELHSLGGTAQPLGDLVSLAGGDEFLLVVPGPALVRVPFDPLGSAVDVPQVPMVSAPFAYDGALDAVWVQKPAAAGVEVALHDLSTGLELSSVSLAAAPANQLSFLEWADGRLFAGVRVNAPGPFDTAQWLVVADPAAGPAGVATFPLTAGSGLQFRARLDSTGELAFTSIDSVQFGVPLWRLFTVDTGAPVGVTQWSLPMPAAGVRRIVDSPSGAFLLSDATTQVGAGSARLFQLDIGSTGAVELPMPPASAFGLAATADPFGVRVFVPTVCPVTTCPAGVPIYTWNPLSSTLDEVMLAADRRALHGVSIPN